MNAMAPPRPTQLQTRRVWLAAGPAAPAAARGAVREAVRSWEASVDLDAADLLTSELVTNAIRHEKGKSVLLAIGCSDDHLRVDVYDTSSSLPVLVEAPTDAETGRGLMLVATLSDEWGSYDTPAGKAVYFVLAFTSGRAPATSERGPQGIGRGDGGPRPLPRFTVPATRAGGVGTRSSLWGPARV